VVRQYLFDLLAFYTFEFKQMWYRTYLADYCMKHFKLFCIVLHFLFQMWTWKLLFFFILTISFDRIEKEIYTKTVKNGMETREKQTKCLGKSCLFGFMDLS
jgi:hypothetical protein